MQTSNYKSISHWTQKSIYRVLTQVLRITAFHETYHHHQFLNVQCCEFEHIYIYVESLIVLYITATRSVTFGYRLNINKLLYLVSSLDTNMSTRAPRVSDKIVAPMTLNYTYAYPHPHTYIINIWAQQVWPSLCGIRLHKHIHVDEGILVTNKVLDSFKIFGFVTVMTFQLACLIIRQIYSLTCWSLFHMEVFSPQDVWRH